MDNQPPAVTPNPQPPEPAPVSAPPKIKHAGKFIFGYLALIVLVAAIAGVYTWQHRKVNSLNAQVNSLQKQVTGLEKTQTKTTTQSTNPYAGWKTYNLASLGVTFQYPSTWTVAQGQPQCTGAIQVSVRPGGAELSQAAAAINASLNGYTILIDKYGTQSTKCSPDGNNFKGASYVYLQSSDELQSGVFKNNWLTFFGSTTGNKSQTLPDTGIVTSSDYTKSPGAFADTGTLTYKGTTYQIEINTTSVVGQQYTQPVPMNITILKTTSLYGDTLGILNTFNN